MNTAHPNRHRTVATASALALILSACGGGGGGGSTVARTPEDATPQQSDNDTGSPRPAERSLSGSIDGFGSVFVGGVRFETDDAEIIVNGEPGSEEDLDLGMVVQLQGTVNDDGVTGTATRIVYTNELKGTVESLEFSRDGDALLAVVLGFNVIIDDNTTFEGVSFDTLAVGDVIEVSGFPEEGNRLGATFVELEDDVTPGRTEVEITGIARNVTSSGFTIGEIAVDSVATRLDEEDGPLAEGVRVRVEGTLQDRQLSASEVETRDGTAGGLQEGDPVAAQGAINSYRDDGDFRIRDLAIDALSATLSPASLVLGNGRIVQVEGTWDGERRVVVAERVISRRGRIELAGAFAEPGDEEGTIILRLAAGELIVATNRATRLEDELEPEVTPLMIGDLRPGEFLEIEAYLDGDSLVATSIERDEADDEQVQAPVEDFLEGSSIQLLGLTYSLDGGTAYENIEDDDIPATAFFAQLRVGDLVKITDGDDNPADAFADEVEVEHGGRQDGGREFRCGFEDDDSSCDEDDLIGDDTRSDDDDREEDDLSDGDDDGGEDDLSDEDDDREEDDLSDEHDLSDEDDDSGQDGVSDGDDDSGEDDFSDEDDATDDDEGIAEDSVTDEDDDSVDDEPAVDDDTAEGER